MINRASVEGVLERPVHIFDVAGRGNGAGAAGSAAAPANAESSRVAKRGMAFSSAGSLPS
jgi:hypothetical protein